MGKNKTKPDLAERLVSHLGSLWKEAGMEVFAEMLDSEFFDSFTKQVKQILNQTNKGRKAFNTRSFTYDASDGKTKVLFVYARARDGSDLKKELLQWRLSKIHLDPTFLPIFIDGGGDEITWIGVRPLDKGTRLEIEMAYDDEEKIESIRQAGSDENAIPYEGI